MSTTPKRIYMDYQATTPVDARVLQAMLPYFSEVFGNAASRNHPFGWDAEKAVENAREQVAALIGAEDKEIVFTSGATESDNLAIMGAARFYREKGNHIITTNIEHKAVLDACKTLESEGFEVSYLPVDRERRISAAQVEAAITDKTRAIVPVHYAGVGCEMDAIMAIAARHKLLVIVSDSTPGETATLVVRDTPTSGAPMTTPVVE